jgi:hypothetical protein
MITWVDPVTFPNERERDKLVPGVITVLFFEILGVVKVGDLGLFN